MTHHDTSWHISFAGFASSQGRACTFHYWLLTSVSTNYETEDTHFQDTTLNARYGLHYEWHWIMLTTLSAHHWIVPLSLRTIYETPFLPTFTPCIIPWFSFSTHHPSMSHISQSTITLSSMMPLFIHHHSHRTTLYSRHSIHNLLHNFLSMQHVLPYWTVCLFEYAPYSTFHPSMNTPSLTPSHHSNTDDAHHCTPCCIQYVCNPAHHSNTAGT